jgi:GH25 family lysozyme M1 (1,4-beta-N-acetylmuramidase)
MTRSVGIDISKWDVSFDPSLATTPIDFVIQRAAFGLTKDSIFDALHVGVDKVLLSGAYQYMLSSISWKTQADAFLSIVNGKGFNFYVCDFEDNSLTARIMAELDSRRAVRSEFLAELRVIKEQQSLLSIDFAAAAMEWCYYVKTQTGKPVVIYSNISTYQEFLSKDSRSKNYPLWIAWPPTPMPNPQTSNPLMPTSRSDWKIWQYSFGEHNTFGKANGVGRTGVDVDVFNGTVNEMRAWLGLDVGTPPPPVEYTDAQKLAILWREASSHGWNLK